MRVAERYLTIGGFCGDAGRQYVARLWDSACTSQPQFGLVKSGPTKSSTLDGNYLGVA
jgi:hypothetical protein